MALALLLLLSLIWKREPVRELIPGETKVKWLNDSTKYYEQAIAIADGFKQIKRLQDSLEKAVSKNSNTKPVTIIRYTESFNRDSLYAAFTSPFKDSINKYKDLADSAFKKQTLMPYEYVDKWTYLKGRVTGGGVAVDSMSVKSKPHIMISETKAFLKPGKLVLQVINENPNIDVSDIQSFTYQPKKKRFGLVVGPTVLYNGKVQVGVGATFGLRIF